MPAHHLGAYTAKEPSPVTDTINTADPVVRFCRDLREIRALALALPGQAIADARAKVDGRALPGGFAMVNLAPVVNIEAWQNVHEFREHFNATHPELPPRDVSYVEDENDGAEPVLQVLRYWTDQYRRLHNAEWDHIPTIDSEANFLTHLAHWAHENEAAWEHLATDINRCRTRLEDILSAGKRQQRTRVTCDRCTKAPRLIILLGSADDGSEDQWKCPECKVKMDRAAMLRAHARQLRHESAAKYVDKRDAIATLRTQGAAERTIRKWISPLAPKAKCAECGLTWPHQEHACCPGKTNGEQCGGELVTIWDGNFDDIPDSYCELGTRRVWVWWPDLWTRHLVLAAKKAARKEIA